MIIVAEDKLSTVVLANLSLQHHVPLFKNAGIDLDQFLQMTEPDFKRLGLDDPRDLGLLSNCSRALSIHIGHQDKDFVSIKSTTSSDDDDSPLLTPSSILNAIHAFDSSRTPSSIAVIPSLQTNTSSAQRDYQTLSLEPGTSRPKARPLSMPIQLPSFTPPPPDYSTWPLSSIYGKRLDKCKSMIFPREEEGKEELPAYSCTVFKMGYVNVKKELESPGIKSRYRGWR